MPELWEVPPGWSWPLGTPPKIVNAPLERAWQTCVAGSRLSLCCEPQFRNVPQRSVHRGSIQKTKTKRGNAHLHFPGTKSLSQLPHDRSHLCACHTVAASACAGPQGPWRRLPAASGLGVLRPEHPSPVALQGPAAPLKKRRSPSGRGQAARGTGGCACPAGVSCLRVCLRRVTGPSLPSLQVPRRGPAGAHPPPHEAPRTQ